MQIYYSPVKTMSCVGLGYRKHLRNYCLPCFLLALALNVTAKANDEMHQLAEARQLLAADKNDEAIAKLRAFSAQFPNAKGVSRELGAAYYHKKDFQQAAIYLERAIEEDPADKDSVQLLGLSYYFSGRPSEAIAPLAQVRSWRPKSNIDAAYVLGLCYLLTHNNDQAKKIFGELYEVQPESAAAHLIVASMLVRQGFDPTAEDEAKKALSLEPHLPLAHFALGQVYLYKSKIPEAIAEFQKELALNPRFAPAYTRLGDAYLRTGQYEDAERLLQNSIWLDSTNSEAYVLMGRTMLKRGQMEVAERTFLRAVALDPNNYQAHLLLGQTYRQNGKLSLAQRELKIGAELQQVQTQNEPR
jgi:tetratricopeptide (TPR) repeat protein